jgi:hypothetical protein
MSRAKNAKNAKTNIFSWRPWRLCARKSPSSCFVVENAFVVHLPFLVAATPRWALRGEGIMPADATRGVPQSARASNPFLVAALPRQVLRGENALSVDATECLHLALPHDAFVGCGIAAPGASW